MSGSSKDSGIGGGEGHQPLVPSGAGQNHPWNYPDNPPQDATSFNFFDAVPSFTMSHNASYYLPMSHGVTPTGLDSLWGYRGPSQDSPVLPPTTLTMPVFNAVTVEHDARSSRKRSLPPVSYPHGGPVNFPVILTNEGRSCGAQKITKKMAKMWDNGLGLVTVKPTPAPDLLGSKTVIEVAVSSDEERQSDGSVGSSSGSSGEDGEGSVSRISDDTRGEKLMEMVDEEISGDMSFRRDCSAENEGSDDELVGGGNRKLGMIKIGGSFVTPRGLEALKEEEGEEEPVTLLAIKDEPGERTMAEIKTEPGEEEGRTMEVVKTEVMTMAEVKTEPEAGPPPSIPSTSAAANTELVPCIGNENRVQVPESPSTSLATPDEVLRERVRQKMKETKFFETEIGQSLQMAILWKAIKPSKLPCVRNGRIMLIGPARFTSLVVGHFERIEMSDNAVPMNATKMKKNLEQHKRDGQASKWKYFIYMMDCDAKFDEEALNRDLKLLANSVDKEERTRIELIYCRSTANTRLGYPSMKTLSSFVTRYDILANTLYHNLNDSIQRTNKYIYSRFVSCATGSFKLFL